jgi:hypothetical protein
VLRRGIYFGGTDMGYILVRERNKRSNGAAYLQITKLCKLLPAVVQLAGVRFSLLVSDSVCPHVATLGESFVADVA